MTTAIRDTSLLAYHSEIKPTLGERQKSVYDEIAKTNNITDKEISRRLGWDINTVTPRRNELLKMRLIFDAGTRKDTVTGRTVHSWTAKKQSALFD